MLCNNLISTSIKSYISMSVVRRFSRTVEKTRKEVCQESLGESGGVNIIRNFGCNLAAGDTDPCTDLPAPAAQITILASSWPPRPPGPCPGHGERRTVQLWKDQQSQRRFYQVELVRSDIYSVCLCPALMCHVTLDPSVLSGQCAGSAATPAFVLWVGEGWRWRGRLNGISGRGRTK